MLEVYVIISLAAAGYLFNSMGNSVKQNKKEVNRFEMPSMTNIYDSQYSKKADDTERMIAERAYKQALKPKKTNRIMSLNGELVDEDNFKHNNMEPYFGGHIRQNMDADRNRAILENYTGVSDIPKQKCEVKSFSDQNKNTTNVYGAPNMSDYYKDRIEAPKLRNNEVPIEQIRVGPGLNLGYTAAPKGGFQQFEDGEIARAGEKCVNELRVKNNPKETYAARTLDGIKAKLPGDVGKVSKNQVERFYEQTPDMYLKTTAATLKPMNIPDFDVKATNRLDTSKEYMGTAKTVDRRQVDPDVKDTTRQQLESGGIRNAVLSILGLGNKDDYGKSNVIVYNNERDLTSTRTYQGNVTSLIKAIIAPIEDMIKVTKKQEYVDNPRHFGQISAQMPEKTTLAPSDNMRTTIKETNIHESINGNLKGPGKLTIWDPTDTARTTIAETLIHDETGRGTLTGPKELYVYDPDEIAKTTIRETLKDVDYTANMGGSNKKTKMYNEDDARTTMKETTIDTNYEGHPSTLAKGDAYDFIDVDARTTQKQFISDNDYYGSVGHDKGEGYITNEHEAKTTQKQFISDRDHYGVAKGKDTKQMSYEEYENAHIDERKETTLFDREPTTQGSKEFNDYVNLFVKKEECKTEREFSNIDKVYGDIPSLTDRTITKTRLAMDLNINDRLDPDLLKAYRDNPYTQRLDSVA